MYYFAYGSNMYSKRLKNRIEGVENYSLGTLRGHKLTFNKVSKDGSGKCDALKTGDINDVVIGVIYTIPDNMIEVLDKYEGFTKKSKNYVRETVNVEVLGTEIPCQIYYADPETLNENIKPYDWYHRHVLYGSVEHNIDNDYICNNILNVPFITDDNTGRVKEESLIYL